MRGSHSVKTFTFHQHKEIHLPEGWKPFGVAGTTDFGQVTVVARKWECSEERCTCHSGKKCAYCMLKEGDV